MRYFYKIHPSVLENRPQLVVDLKVIFQIPWGHHIQIFGKCKRKFGKSFVLCEKDAGKQLVQSNTYEFPVKQWDSSVIAFNHRTVPSFLKKEVCKII